MGAFVWGRSGERFILRRFSIDELSISEGDARALLVEKGGYSADEVGLMRLSAVLDLLGDQYNERDGGVVDEIDDTIDLEGTAVENSISFHGVPRG